MATRALIVVDMQNFFASMGTAAIPNIKKLYSFFKDRSLPIIFTQHGHTKEELTPPFKNQVVRRWGPDSSVVKGTSDWELMPEIEKLARNSMIVEKNTYDAFINTDLTSILEDHQVESLVVCGVMTDCCCDTTARSASNRGYETWLIGDACGSADDKQHEAGLRGFEFMFKNVMSTSEAISRLQEEL